jgi:hypothetical protein
MSTQIQVEHFTNALHTLLDETFDHVQGYYLDRGTSMFETLATISAGEASVPVGGKCATLAAQVKHTTFYLEVVVRNVRSGTNERVDWGEIWRTTSTVTPDEWAAIQARLRTAYDGIRALIAYTPEWQSEETIGGAIATVVHTACHLGEIRQALCALKP